MDAAHRDQVEAVPGLFSCERNHCSQGSWTRSTSLNKDIAVATRSRRQGTFQWAQWAQTRTPQTSGQRVWASVRWRDWCRWSSCTTPTPSRSWTLTMLLPTQVWTRWQWDSSRSRFLAWTPWARHQRRHLQANSCEQSSSCACASTTTSLYPARLRRRWWWWRMSQWRSTSTRQT